MTREKSPASKASITQIIVLAKMTAAKTTTVKIMVCCRFGHTTRRNSSQTCRRNFPAFEKKPNSSLPLPADMGPLDRFGQKKKDHQVFAIGDFGWFFAGPEGFEPPTRGFGVRCSASWSYGPRSPIRTAEVFYLIASPCARCAP